MSRVLVHMCIVGCLAVYTAYLYAYAVSPKDPAFFYAVTHHISDSWIMFIISMALEFVSLTTTATSGMFVLLAPLSYVITMTSSLR